jgi:hypothetical protein
MSKTLSDIWGHAFKDQFWLWCDIDGHGQQWKLAVPLDDEQLFFPHDQFEDYAGNYMSYPAREIIKPLESEDMP